MADAAACEGLVPLVPIKAQTAFDYDLAFTRAADIAISLVALLLLSPIMLLVALAVFVSDPGPLLFAHRRIGRGGRTFPCLKFRTMVVDSHERLQQLLAESEEARREWELDHKLKNDPRITAIGKILRRSSLDELPQLFNVLRGQMSLVGPRPIVEAEVWRYGRYFSEYCRVSPGITGLWQISGRNNLNYRRRVAIDVRYTRIRSFKLDMAILIATVPAVLAARGSY